MAHFYATGKYLGEDSRLDWEDGRVTGTKAALDRVYEMAGNSSVVGPVGGPYTTRDHLEDPLSAMILFSTVLVESDVKFYGDIPRVPQPPDGSIV